VDRTEQDLDLAVALVNTDIRRADLGDRLTDIAVFQEVLAAAGDADLAGELSARDLAPLRAFRAQLPPVFAAGTVEDAVAHLDPLLAAATVPARLSVGDGAAHWAWGADQRGLPALKARLLVALASHLLRHGNTRLGVCQADPCRCVYVDRSRARTRRYCCDQCNDRAAAAAYRERKAR
jgi:predicted RNA-binding Zn ribbon-like protein